MAAHIEREGPQARVGEGGEENRSWHAGAQQPAQRSQRRDPVQAGHLPVNEHHVEGPASRVLLLHKLQRCLTAGCRSDLHAEQRQALCLGGQGLRQVIDDQGAQAVQRHRCRTSGCVLGVGQVHPDPEPASLTDNTVRARIATHHSSQVPRQRQAQPRAPVAARARGVCLFEGFEQQRQALRLDAWACVLHLESKLEPAPVVSHHGAPQPHPAGVGELHGVGQQVDQCL